MKSINENKYNKKIFDRGNKDSSLYKAKLGINEEVVREISNQKKEPAWMLEKRLDALRLFNETKLPNWGPDISNLNLDDICYYVRPDAKEVTSWDEVPKEIHETFEKLGIPKAEREHLAGVGAQYDSDSVYHKLKENLLDKGVIFENMDTALHKYPEMVKEYFMTSCVPVHDHKFTMLHGAVWSGGTFIYIPKGVHVELPLQAYFRMNAQGSGQFEHTIIIADEESHIEYIEGCSAPQYNKNSIHAGCVEIFVKEKAVVKYFSIENWSKNVYNLNTKRALVDKDASIEWVSGNMGSCTTMLYPCSVLRGENSSSNSLGIAFAGKGQTQDTGSKVIHSAPNTKSNVRSKSISVDGGINTYRGLVKITKKANNSDSLVECDALIMDELSQSNTIPKMKVENSEVSVAHEAKVGKIGDDELFYIQSRGLSLEQAQQMIVTGFVNPIVQSLPMEYAIELQRLIMMETEGAIG